MSRRPDLNLKPAFYRQLRNYEQRLISKSKHPFSFDWCDTDFSHLECEELLLRNTYINSQMVPDLKSKWNERRRGPRRLVWADEDVGNRHKKLPDFDRGSSKWQEKPSILKLILKASNNTQALEEQSLASRPTTASSDGPPIASRPTTASSDGPPVASFESDNGPVRTTSVKIPLTDNAIDYLRRCGNWQTQGATSIGSAGRSTGHDFQDPFLGFSRTENREVSCASAPLRMPPSLDSSPKTPSGVTSRGSTPPGGMLGKAGRENSPKTIALLRIPGRLNQAPSPISADKLRTGFCMNSARTNTTTNLSVVGGLKKFMPSQHSAMGKTVQQHGPISAGMFAFRSGGPVKARADALGERRAQRNRPSTAPGFLSNDAVGGTRPASPLGPLRVPSLASRTVSAHAWLSSPFPALINKPVIPLVDISKRRSLSSHMRRAPSPTPNFNKNPSPSKPRWRT